MRIVAPSSEVFFLLPEDGKTPEQFIEQCARTCYKSEDRIGEGTAEHLITTLLKRDHGAMLEFGSAAVRIIGDRGLSHELVRHRLASFAQESTRYCNYGKDKFDAQITIIDQPDLTPQQRELWLTSAQTCEDMYLQLLTLGAAPQLARAVLPICLKTDIWVMTNLREWRHIFKMRCATTAHPTIRKAMCEVLRKFYNKMPTIYRDLYERFIPAELNGPAVPHKQKVRACCWFCGAEGPLDIDVNKAYFCPACERGVEEKR